MAINLILILFVLQSSPSDLMAVHSSSCLPAAFCHSQRARLHIGPCLSLSLTSFIPSCTRVEMSKLPLHQGQSELVPHLERPEQASSNLDIVHDKLICVTCAVCDPCNNQKSLRRGSYEVLKKLIWSSCGGGGSGWIIRPQRDRQTKYVTSVAEVAYKTNNRQTNRFSIC